MDVMRCDQCGRFISYKDIESGKAIWRMILPDSEFSKETWEGLCPEHYKPKGQNEKKSL